MQTPHMLPKFVFLDRDGVINTKLPPGRFVTSPEDLALEPGAAAAIARLNVAGITVIVVTNQRGVALELFTEEALRLVHARLRDLLAKFCAHLDAIYYCPHQRDACNCRKPLPGMFYKAFTDFPGADAANSLLVGDSLSDIQAGCALGMTTVFVEGRSDTQDPGAEEAMQLATFRAASLGSFVDLLLQSRNLEPTSRAALAG